MATSTRSAPIAVLVAIGRSGLVAGAVGSVAMDTVWYRRYRREGGTASFGRWEFLSVPAGFEDAPAPARVGQIIAERAHITLPDRAAGTTNNVVHWATGLSWGVAAALLRLLPGVGPLQAGLTTGIAAWGTSYAVLPKLGVYKPITQYDAATLWKDLSAHLVYGTAAGATVGVARRLWR